MAILTEQIGSIPRSPSLLQAMVAFQAGKVSQAEMDAAYADAVRDTIQKLEQTRSPIITDGEQTRLDFNLSFYGYLEGLELEGASPRRFGPPAHDQRGKHKVTGELRSPRGPRGIRASDLPGVQPKASTST